MADEDELYLANLDEFVNDGDKIVTYKWLSRTLSVPVNKAKQMLYAFVQRQKELKSGSHLNVTYVIGGRYIVDGDTAQRYVVTNDKDLEETKRTFSVVTSLHIYSVQKCKLKDSNSLYTVDYDIQQEHKGEGNRWSHICCPSAKHLSDDSALGFRDAQNVNGIAHDVKKYSSSKMVNGESSSICKGPSAVGKEQNSKASNSKTKKGQISALEMFAAKPSTSKTEKSNNKSEGGTRKDEDESKAAQRKSDSKKTGSMTSFFGQNRTVKKVPEKMETTESEKGAAVPGNSETTIPQKQTQTVETNSSKKRELASEDEEEPLPPKLSKAIKPDVKENQGLKRDKNEVKKKEEKIAEQSISTKAGKKKAVLSDSDEEPEEKPKKKRRKRMKELPKEDSSDNEETVTNRESDKKLSSDKSDSPLPPQQVRPTENDTASRRRKRKRELKSKTYMNDEGFMVTEKVWESESTDASDDDVQMNEPQVKEKRPSPAKKTNKKTHPDIKHKAAKQASLISFFKKS